METVSFIKAHWADVLNVLTYTVTIASIVVKWTENTVDDNVVTRLLKIISLAPKSVK